MNASYAYNNAVDVFDSPASYEDPTCTATAFATPGTAVCPGEQIYAPESAGSGIGNVFQNSKWLVKLNGRVQLPWDFNLAANYMGRQGFPFPQSVLTPNRANGGGQVAGASRSAGRRPLRQHCTRSTSALDRTFRFGTRHAHPGARRVQPDQHQHRARRRTATRRRPTPT